MLFNLKTLLPVAIILITLSACKKNKNDQDTDSSNDEIVLSIENAPDVHYNKPTYNIASEFNSSTQVSFVRLYYTTPVLVPQQYNVINFAFYDPNILSNPLPYQVKKFFFSISMHIPIYGDYSYTNYINQTKGHIEIILNYAKNQRLKGTFKGEIYNTYKYNNEPDSLNVHGSFDIKQPPLYN